jgi:hypothetical protein
MTPRAIDAVVTTFDAVLRISIDLQKQSIASEVIERCRGIYFGLTRCDGRVLVAARNLDINGRLNSAEHATNVICSLDVATHTMTPMLAHPCPSDLHQIRAVGRWLWVVVDERSRIAIFERRHWKLVSMIDLAALVPDPLRHDAPEDRPSDHYHFNSITFCRGSKRALVLAHNWQYGSFALELTLGRCWGAGGEVRLGAVHEGLGTEAHDVIEDRRTLHVLDSGGNALIARGKVDRRVPLAGEPGRAFPRGLAISRRHIFICYGAWSVDRASRARTESRIRVLDRPTLGVVLDESLGDYGNPCDILLLSPRDVSDGAGSGFLNHRIASALCCWLGFRST